MGSVRRDDENHDCSCARTRCPRHNRCSRSLYRREFRARQKGGSKVGKTKRGKGTKIMAVADRNGLPVAVCVESATPHEVKLVIPTLVQMVIPDAPRNLIGDDAYDSDKLDTKLGSYGMSDPPQNLPDNAPVVKGVGFKHYVIHAVWERMRWHYTV